MKNLHNLIIVCMCLAVFTGSPAKAQESTEARTYIKLEVNGLACPFCAYGLEKKLKKLDGASDLKIFIQEGFATFHVPPERRPTEEQLKKIVADAGFEARSVEFSEQPFAAPDKNGR